MPKTTRPRAKVRLLQAGIKEFSAHGYRGASLRDIAKLADTNVAAIKYHFGSKEIFWKEVVSHLYQSLAATMLGINRNTLRVKLRDRQVKVVRGLG